MCTLGVPSDWTALKGYMCVHLVFPVIGLLLRDTCVCTLGVPSDCTALKGYMCVHLVSPVIGLLLRDTCVYNWCPQ